MANSIRTNKQKLQHLLYLHAPGSLANCRNQIRAIELELRQNLDPQLRLADKQQVGNILQNFILLDNEIINLKQRLVAIRKRIFENDQD